MHSVHVTQSKIWKWPNVWRKRNTRTIKNIKWCLKHFFSTYLPTSSKKNKSYYSHSKITTYVHKAQQDMFYTILKQTRNTSRCTTTKNIVKQKDMSTSTVLSIALYCFSFCKGEVKCSLNYVTELNTQNSYLHAPVQYVAFERYAHKRLWVK